MFLLLWFMFLSHILVPIFRDCHLGLSFPFTFILFSFRFLVSSASYRPSLSELLSMDAKMQHERLESKSRPAECQPGIVLMQHRKITGELIQFFTAGLYQKWRLATVVESRRVSSNGEQWDWGWNTTQRVPAADDTIVELAIIAAQNRFGVPSQSCVTVV